MHCARPPFAALAIVLVAAGCGGTNPALPDDPAVVSSTSAPEPEPSASSLSVTDLQSAPVPSACEHPPGTLVYGKLPLVPDGDGGVWLATDPDGSGEPFHLEASLTGDGPQILAVLDCNRGGVGWPQVLVLYGPGPTLLGSFDLITLEFTDGDARVASEHVTVQDLRALDGGVQVELATYDGAGFELRTWSGVVHLRESNLVVEDLALVSGPDNPYPALP